MAPGVRALFSTRFGGVSTGVWAEANLALHVGDDPDAVQANRRTLAARLGADVVGFPEQVHGAEVAGLDQPPPPEGAAVLGGAPGADAIVTALAGVPVGVLVADCMPVLLADPQRRVVGAVHAGRRGLSAGVLQRAVRAMVERGAEPAAIGAVIGPSICGRCYEVPGDMRDEIEAAVPGTAATTRQGTPSLDLPGGAVGVLRAEGLTAVRVLGLCTAEDERFYSYRRSGRTGRFAGVVMLDGDD